MRHVLKPYRNAVLTLTDCECNAKYYVLRPQSTLHTDYVRSVARRAIRRITTGSALWSFDC